MSAINTADTGTISAYQTARSDGLMPDQTMSAVMKMVRQRGRMGKDFCIGVDVWKGVMLIGSNLTGVFR